MKLILINLIAILLTLSSCGSYPISESNEVVEAPDEFAQFPGKPDALSNYIQNSIRYPEEAMDAGEQGKVFVEFVVEKNGDITNIRVLKSVSKALDNETIRIVQNMPKWEPDIYNKEYVRSKVRFPVNFILN